MAALLIRVVARFGLRSLLDLYRSSAILTGYVKRGVLGYALVVAKKGEARCAAPAPVDRPLS